MNFPPSSSRHSSVCADAARWSVFRPFAPSLLEGRAEEYFVMPDAARHYPARFMLYVVDVRREKQAIIPAVTHVDGSGRLQTVTWAGNPRYARLIQSFRDITGVPIVLNTSFNENEPVVCKPEEAIDCFLRTKMDVLVLGDTFIER